MNNESGIKNKTTIKSFTDLNAWKEGHTLVLMIYNMTKLFPRDKFQEIALQSVKVHKIVNSLIKSSKNHDS